MKNKIKTLAFEAGFYSQVVIIECQPEINYIKEGSSNKDDTYIQPKISSSLFKENLENRIIGSSLILNGILKNSIQWSRVLQESILRTCMWSSW